MKLRQYLQQALAILAVSVVASSASARTVNNVTITEIAELKTGKVWVRFNASISGTKPTCVAAGWEDYLAFDATTTAGSRMLTVIWAAMLAGKRVDVSGLGNTCVNVNGGTGTVEEFNYIKVYSN
jgi:hypothetical protein